MPRVHHPSSSAAGRGREASQAAFPAESQVSFATEAAVLQSEFRQGFSEVAKKSVSARPGPILEGTLGSRMGPGRAGDGPHLGTWMGPKHCKTKHMANLDRTTSDPGWDLDGPRIGTQARVWMAPPRDSNRLLGLSEFLLETLV